jgi:hypothetical protein
LSFLELIKRFYNGDIAQYSTYVIENLTSVWIETLIYKTADSGSRELFCLIRIQNIGEIVEFTPVILKNAYFGYPTKAKTFSVLNKSS